MNQHRWHLEIRKIEDLSPNLRNPRYISEDAGEHLRTSITKFGLIDKPIITSSGFIIGGHQRINILYDMNQTEVECWVCDEDTPLSDDEISELTIRLNKNIGRWDDEKLANEWDLKLLCEWGFEPKDFEDPLIKVKKPKVVLEFVDEMVLCDALKYIKKIEETFNEKVVVRVKHEKSKRINQA